MSIILKIKSEDEFCELSVTKKQTIIGRSSKADLTIDDERMSSRHCSVTLSNEGKVLLRDLGSTNGTFLGASQVENAEILIGDKVRIGNTIMSIDKSSLSLKEAKMLKKSEDATQVRYLDLKSSEDSTQHAINIRKKAIVRSESAKSKNKETAKEGKTKHDLKEQIVKKAKKVSKSNRYDYDDEDAIDMIPETGTTGLIKIEKLLKTAGTKTRTKFANKMAKARAKRNADKENESIFDKIKSLFKKKS